MFNYNMFAEPLIPRSFNSQYRCYSVSMFPGSDKQKVEYGGKIIMPPSALEVLTRLNIVYPMLFKLTNKKGNRITHCGVLEFLADEGKIYIPYWMMRNLLLDEGDFIQVEAVSLPVATFSKFEPQSVDFLDISNQKAVLENALRHFACLTKDEIIAVYYNNRIYELRVLDVKPGNAVSIIECDMNVDFAPPVGYQEPQKNNSNADADMDEKDDEDLGELPDFMAFQGSGHRLDGKKRNLTMSQEEIQKNVIRQRGVPNYDYKMGYIKFWRKNPKIIDSDKDEAESFEAFKGEGTSLRQGKRILKS